LKKEGIGQCVENCGKMIGFMEMGMNKKLKKGKRRGGRNAHI
jgi:hypothetical protein